jgi:hypothetical protein
MKDVGTALQNRAEQVSTGADTLIAKVRDWQTIKQYLCNRLGETKLTATQQKKLDRYQYIYNQMVSGKYTDQDVVHQVMNVFNVSIAQAYEDMKHTREIFPSAINLNKKFELVVELQVLKKARIKCEEMGDMKTAVQYSKVINEVHKQLEFEEESLGDLFEGHTIEAVHDPSLLGAPPVNMKELLSAINAKRNKKIKIDMFEEIPYVETQKENGS